MDKLVYVAMNAAQATIRSQAVNSQNLANISTTGFRADLESFASVPMDGNTLSSRVYSSVEGKGINFAPGAMMGTGRDLDIAVKTDGWISVQAPDGSEAYTRAGDLRVDSLGLLRTGTGLAVMGNGAPIAIPPFEKIEIGSDGTITIRPVGQEANALAVVDRIKLVNPPTSELEKGSDGLIRLKSREPAEADASVQVQSGVLESSNVNAVEAMVNMIKLARQFEAQVKIMANAEENDRASTQLMRMG